MADDRKRAAIYARQSKDRLQGIQAQIADCTALIRGRGWEVTTTIPDNDVSASSSKARPGYTRLLTMIEQGDIDVVVVSHVDRLLRSMVDLEGLIKLIEKHGVGVVTVSGDLDLTTDAGRLVGRILAAVARGEVERKGARQKRGNEASAAAGKPRKAAPRPFGWQDDRRSLNLAEASAIADGCVAILRGATVTGVMRDWIGRGLRSPQAPFGPLPGDLGWTRTSVREILTSPRIAAISAYKDLEFGAGDWEPVVGEETLRAVAWQLAQRRRDSRGVATLLGGLAFCRCGNHVTGTVNRHGQPTYRCHSHTRDGRPGPHVHVSRAAVDEHVASAAVAYLSRPDVAEQVITPPGEDTAALRDEETVVQVRLRRLGALYVDGAITEADLISGSATGVERLAAIQAELALAGRGSVLTPLVMAASVAAEWESLDTARRRAVIDELMTVTLYPSGAGRRFDRAVVLPPGRGIVWKEGSHE